jgi:hypothetical protein
VIDSKTTVSNTFPFLAVISDDPYVHSRIDTEHEHRGVCAVFESSIAARIEAPPQAPEAQPTHREVRGVVVAREIPPAVARCEALGPVQDDDDSYNRARIQLVERAKQLGARYLHLREVSRQGEGWRLEGTAYRCAG